MATVKTILIPSRTDPLNAVHGYLGCGTGELAQPWQLLSGVDERHCPSIGPKTTLS